jgi:hypothetical protein
MALQLAVGAVVLAHLLFIATCLFGALLLSRWPRFLWVQLPVFLWGAVVNLLNWECPLTHLENVLRARAGLPVYGESFVSHYLLPECLRQLGGAHTSVVVGVVVLLLNAVGYARYFLRQKARRAR